MLRPQPPPLRPQGNAGVVRPTPLRPQGNAGVVRPTPLRPRGSLALAFAAGTEGDTCDEEQDYQPEEAEVAPVPTLCLAGYALPKVVVFDLDETCWDHFGLDHKPPFRPPFTWSPPRGEVVDASGRAVRVFPELRQVILSLHRAGVAIAVASHDGQPAWCRQVMDAFVLDSSEALTWGDLVPEELTFIKHSGQYWPGKTQHFRDILANLPDCDFSEMLVFDDSKSVCKQATNLGAAAVRCVGGVSVARLLEGLRGLAPRQGLKRKAEAA